MMKSILLTFTETGDISLPTAGITIFVGPNNSGKSLILREIESAFENHVFPNWLKILKSFEIVWPSIEIFDSEIAESIKRQPADVPAGSVRYSRLKPGGGRETSDISVGNLRSFIAERSNKSWVLNQYLKWGVIRLDGRSRFELTNDKQAGDLLAPPQNVLAHLFQDDAARIKIRSMIFDAFNLHFVVDPTMLGQLRIRLSTDIPPGNEQSLDANAREFYAKALHIKDASDGVQAFTGIVTAVRSGDFHTILIDEPEAFLHPPLARKLGQNLAALAAERNGSLMASTHSADFLMGCVQASPSVRVVRLEYSGGRSRARMIDSAALDTFLKRPLMRSANVISGLFHDGVIVLESDNDRVFYAEIYHRMSEGRSDYPSILFINAQNKQTIKDIVGPLRRFGVPAAAVPDIDFVKDGGKTWTDWLNSAQIPKALHTGYGQQRSSINDALKQTDMDMKSDGGLALLPPDDRQAAEQLFSNLEDFGIFPVRVGELENWLPDLAVAGKKTDWAIAMLERLGSDPSNPQYVKPSDGDVWEFMERVVAWIRDPSRKGIT